MLQGRSHHTNTTPSLNYSEFIFLQPQNIRLLTHSIVEAIQTQCPTMQDDAMVVEERFATAFGLFAKCHNAYAQARGMSSEEIEELGMYTNIQDTINT